MSAGKSYELSPEAVSLLANLQSRSGKIRGNTEKDEVMWLYRTSYPGQTVDTAAVKELKKRGLLELHMDLPDGTKQYRLSASGEVKTQARPTTHTT